MEEQAHMNNLISILPLHLSLLKVARRVIAHLLRRLSSRAINLQPEYESCAGADKDRPGMQSSLLLKVKLWCFCE